MKQYIEITGVFRDTNDPKYWTSLLERHVSLSVDDIKIKIRPHVVFWLNTQRNINDRYALRKILTDYETFYNAIKQFL